MTKSGGDEIQIIVKGAKSIIFYADTTNSRNLEDVFCETPFRCALLVDKDEVVATCIDNSERFCIPMLDVSPHFLQLARMLAVNR